MADTHTTSLRLRLLEVNANEDTWGTELNENVISMLEESIAGVVSISVTGSNVTLTTADGTTDQARNALIILTGTPGTTRTVTFPNVEKLTHVINNSDGAATLTAGAGTTVSVPAGSSRLIYTDGATNVAQITPGALSGVTTLPGSGQISANGRLGLGMTPVNEIDISGSANGAVIASILNNNAGTAAYVGLKATNGTAQCAVYQLGTGWTTSGINRQNGGLLESTGVGGMTVHSFNAAGFVVAAINNVEVARFDNNATAGNTRFMIYDVDNGTVERVSVGAADSGGVGFKVLRIPN